MSQRQEPAWSPARPGSRQVQVLEQPRQQPLAPEPLTAAASGRLALANWKLAPVQEQHWLQAGQPVLPEMGSLPVLVEPKPSWLGMAAAPWKARTQDRSGTPGRVPWDVP